MSLVHVDANKRTGPLTFAGTAVSTEELRINDRYYTDDERLPSITHSRWAQSAAAGCHC